jgi:hypothetical protein
MATIEPFHDYDILDAVSRARHRLYTQKKLVVKPKLGNVPIMRLT